MSVVRPRACRIFCGVAIGGALWGALAALHGDDPTRAGINGLPLGSAQYGLIVAAGSGLIAWALSLARVDSEGVAAPGWGRFAALIGVLVIVLNLLLMAQPPPPTNACQTPIPIGHGFLHFLNCDSLTYLGLANKPSESLNYRILQSRPLAFTLPFLIAQPLRLVPRIEKAGPFRPLSREFIGFLFINLAALIVAVVLFRTVIEASTGRPLGLEMIPVFVTLVANDVTKLFFWTPHTQIFNLFVPCLTVYIGFRLLQRGRVLSPGAALVLGLALGIGLLEYGSFAVTALCVSVIQMVCYRRPGPAVIVAIAAIVPYAGWVALVYGLTGAFYNHEVVAYRQFVWMLDCARNGLTTCGPVARAHLGTFFTTALPVVATPALMVLACRLARRAWPGAVTPPGVAPALPKAIAITLIVSIVFLAAMGFYAPRLCWLLVPPILMLAAVEFQAFRLSRPGPLPWLLHVATAVGCLSYVLILAARHGPYN